MTAPTTKPRALRRLERLHDAKSLGRDKAQAQRLQKATGEPSPQSYDPAPGTPPGGKITSTAPRPAPGDGTSPGRISDAYRAADALDLVEGRRARAPAPAAARGGTFGSGGRAELSPATRGPGPGAYDVAAAEASLRSWPLSKLASTASRFHEDEVAAQRAAVGPGPAAYDTYVPPAAPAARLVGREGLQAFGEPGFGVPGAGAYDTRAPLSRVGGAMGREPRGGAFAADAGGPGPGVDAMPSFLASVAATPSVASLRPRHETPRPGAAAVLAARRALGASPGPAYDTARAYGATARAAPGVALRPQHLVATPLDRIRVPAPRFARPPPKNAPPSAFEPPALPNAPVASRFCVAPTVGRATRREYRKRYLASFRACRDAGRTYGAEAVRKNASGREFEKEGLGFAARRPVAPTRGAEAERATRLAGRLLAPDPRGAAPRARSGEGARPWADATYDVYVPPRSDTMRATPPAARAPPAAPREAAGDLFFDGVRALLDDAYRARLVARPAVQAPPRGADHGVDVPPTARLASDLVFLDDARERPSTDF